MPPTIDPREFGRLEAQVEALQSQLNDLSVDVKALLELANRSKGGLWLGMGMASAIGGVVTWVATHLPLLTR